jgi:Rad3-related DNA helicase
VRRAQPDRSPRAALPWEASADAGVAFAVLWTTGPDPRLDGVFRLLALRPAGDGSWETFDRCSDPFAGCEDEAVRATARMQREFGITRVDLAGAVPLAEAWAAFDAFLGNARVVAPDGEAFEAWWEHLAGAPRRAPGIGLTEIAALLAPGRRAGGARGLLATHGRGRGAGPPRAIHPTDLQAALVELVRQFSDGDARVARVAASGYARAWEVLRAVDPGGAARLAFALALVDRPSAWAASTGALFPGAVRPRDGALAAGYDAGAGAEELLADLWPHAAAMAAPWSDESPLPPTVDGESTFDAEDARVLDDVFRVHLPALLAGELGGEPATYYRAAQHAVARAIAGTLGADELLLVHAPTGTGKTLAYLVPALLWARRYGARVGVATYTRALQEQAMDREVPRALQALARAGVAGGLRISLLKGRENYLCWRALRLVAPADDDDGEAWLAWTTLALFALGDPDGDLDRFPQQPPVRLDASADYRRALVALVRQVRAQTSCCTAHEDRATCAAELARRRAERSHVVLTNQSFALARQEFLRHLVFDECEHLHEQAHGAWSHRFSFRALRDVLARLDRGGRGRGPLARLARQFMPGTPSSAALDEARTCRAGVLAELDRLGRELEVFDRWRLEAERGRGARETHGLLRAYLDGAHAPELVAARRALRQAAAALEAALAELSAHVDALPVRGAARIRRALDLTRGDLVESGAALESWLPLDDGRPCLRKETFYDVEVDAQGEPVLAARVLLPNAYLGRHYHPSLASAAFLSATTRLAGGFDAARGYLGLDVVAREPAGEGERPRRVRTFHAPEVFDYSRVLIGVPRDAPPPNVDKGAFLDYVERFIAYLGARTRGRMLVLFTNREDVRAVGTNLARTFRERRVPLWFQGMAEAGKEELSELFRERADSVLLGVDTFWYGADFPGETLEYLVIVKLPYGVPDRYHHAQCAVLGEGRQRQDIYLPRALAKFRQGFGRLMRRRSDRGCVFLLDQRVLDPRHRHFLRELPLGMATGFQAERAEGVARLVRGDTDFVVREALAHMDMLSDVQRRGLTDTFADGRARVPGPPPPAARDAAPARAPRDAPPRLEIDSGELPF